MEWFELFLGQAIQKNFFALSIFAMLWTHILIYFNARFRRALKEDQIVHVETGKDIVQKCRILKLPPDGKTAVVVDLKSQKIHITMRSKIFAP